MISHGMKEILQIIRLLNFASSHLLTHVHCSWACLPVTLWMTEVGTNIILPWLIIFPYMLSTPFTQLLPNFLSNKLNKRYVINVFNLCFTQLNVLILSGMNTLIGYDLVPEPKILEAALKACRRLNDLASAIRILEAVKVREKASSEVDNDSANLSNQQLSCFR